jgi:hypothetical protein
MRKCSKIVGRIHGKAVGGGVELPACDLLATIESYKTLQNLRLGLVQIEPAVCEK